MDKIEQVAQAMYWNRVNPSSFTVTLSVAVQPWECLADEYRSGIQIWHCKSFWRQAARAAIEAMREPRDFVV